MRIKTDKNMRKNCYCRQIIEARIAIYWKLVIISNRVSRSIKPNQIFI